MIPTWCEWCTPPHRRHTGTWPERNPYTMPMRRSPTLRRLAPRRAHLIAGGGPRRSVALIACDGRIPSSAATTAWSGRSPCPAVTRDDHSTSSPATTAWLGPIPCPEAATWPRPTPSPHRLRRLHGLSRYHVVRRRDHGKARRRPAIVGGKKNDDHDRTRIFPESQNMGTWSTNNRIPKGSAGPWRNNDQDVSRTLEGPVPQACGAVEPPLALSLPSLTASMKMNDCRRQPQVVGNRQKAAVSRAYPDKLVGRSGDTSRK